jgi:site-specific recombinase XerD
MAAKQTKDGWKVDFRVGGKDGKRYRKTCKTKSEAERYQKFVEGQSMATGRPWNDKPTDPRRLSELAELWRQHYGIKLIDHVARQRIVNNIVLRLGDPIASQLTPALFNRYLSTRTEEGKKPETTNKEIMAINAVYNGLKRLDIIDYDNPITGVKRTVIRQTEKTYLSREQMIKLLGAFDSLDSSAGLIARVCLSTGARWGEAEKLTASRIQNQKVTFLGKNGKTRSIPISKNLHDKLKDHAQKIGQNDLFKPSMTLFYAAIKTAKITLPKGQKTHVLRHTFASHFMINGGSILSLQKILDHSNISMTMRYAHLSPNHMIEALQYNPLEKVEGQK